MYPSLKFKLCIKTIFLAIIIIRFIVFLKSNQSTIKMELWNFILNEIKNNRNGSSPGIVGFKMAVTDTGNMIGSIGGGVMEYNMVELAKKTAKSNTQDSFIKKQIHKPDAGKDKSGLMCSGEQTHAFVAIDNSDIETIQSIVSILDKGNHGKLSLSEKGLFFDEVVNRMDSIEFNYEDANKWEYIEQIGLKPTLYIFGAGHVSVPLSQIFRAIDFNVIVFDNRNDLSTFDNNTFANRKEIIDYKKACNYAPEGENSYVVIMTVGHKSDELILEQFVTKNLKYLGMIGSKNKVNTIFESLISKGISESDLAKVDAPMGINISSKTTPEIGISIAAKVIQVKNTK